MFKQVCIAIEAEALYARLSRDIGIYRNDSHSRTAAWGSFAIMGWIH